MKIMKINLFSGENKKEVGGGRCQGGDEKIDADEDADEDEDDEDQSC